MTLGERCDEIVRLIDETLLDCAASVPLAAGLRPARRQRAEPGDDAGFLAGPLARSA
jgi:hypothetical protein